MPVRVLPDDALLDEPFEIEWSGGPLSVALTGSDGRRWSTELTEPAGRADGSTVVASLSPEPGERGMPWSEVSLAPRELELEAGGETARALRRAVADGVTRYEVRADGVVGTLFVPVGDGPFPAVLEFGGSSGGLSEGRAALLASRGVVALTVAFFAYENLPPSLVEIPLEYFRTAIEWLLRRPEVRDQKAAVLGTSKGGELALLVGATYPDLVDDVVALVPSGVTFFGVPTPDHPDGRLRSSWSLDGAPVPFVPCPMEVVDSWTTADGPIRSTTLYEVALDDAAAVQAATIAVEQISGDVLLVSGDCDGMWPSTRLARIAEERRRSFGRPVTHLVCAGAGHRVGTGVVTGPLTVTQVHHRITGLVYDLGGSAVADHAGLTDAWPRVLDVLR